MDIPWTTKNTAARYTIGMLLYKFRHLKNVVELDHGVKPDEGLHILGELRSEAPVAV
jgi:hypothetical protein